MFRRSLILMTAVGVATAASIDLSACGDKFLRAGRSQRTKGYAAIYPASILIYKPSATPKGLQMFEALLRKAGHKTTALQDPGALARALASTKYDIVIADYPDTGELKTRLGGGAEAPGVLPILEKPTKTLEAEVAKQYHCVIKPEKMTKYDALDEIDHLMELRRKRTAAAIAPK